MEITIAHQLMIPFVGTALGSACVLFMKKEMDGRVQKLMTGFAAGVMTAASFWSLLLPSLESSSHMGRLAFVPAVVGFLLGIGFLLALDTFTPHMHMDSEVPEGPKSGLSKTSMLIMAVALHNIPEGMAVGVAGAGWEMGSAGISATSALALALGIAIQNFPEGAIISMPLASSGMSRKRAFLCGVASGAAEPIAGAITLALSETLVPFMPYLLAFAAGAMLYVVVEELIPEMSAGGHSNAATIVFALGFSMMIILDVALG